MQTISAKKHLNYFMKMYRKVVLFNFVLALLLIVQSLLLIYFYEKQPGRRFFSSANTYNVTEIYPLNSE